MVKYNILDKDIYNIDKNIYMIDISENIKMIFSKYQNQAFIKQAKN